VWSANSSNVIVAPGETKIVELDAKVASAEPWDVQHPNLYQASATFKGLAASDRSVDFSFRYFTAEGIGSNDAKLILNGKRVVPISAISWGFWGRNGLWPDEEMAEREVTAAKKLGLSCLHFHRNIGKPAVLDIQDRKGLMRVEEPGGGKFVVGARYARGPFGTNDEFLGKDERLLSALEIGPFVLHTGIMPLTNKNVRTASCCSVVNASVTGDSVARWHFGDRINKRQPWCGSEIETRL
jgi:beta-galactosidase